MLNTIRVFLPLALIFTLIIGGFIWVWNYNQPPENITNLKTTVGTIVDFEQGTKSSGEDAVIKYKFKGKSYKSYIGSYKYKANILGEKYVVVFDSLDPKNSVVLVHQPIFNKNERTATTLGEISRLYQKNWSSNKFISNYGIEFKYTINGQSFTKAQSLQPNYKNIYPDLKEGDQFQIEYLQQNPERSILILK